MRDIRIFDYYLILMFYYFVNVIIAKILCIKINDIFEIDNNIKKTLNFICKVPIVNTIFIVLILISYFNNLDKFDE